MKNMVRGRRVRAVVACARNDDCCSPHPKRKDQKIHINAKLTHTVLTTGTKTHSITDFFQAVEIDDSKHIIDTITPFETNAENEHSSTNGDSKKIEQNPTIQDIPKTPVIVKKTSVFGNKSPPTPHRIELCPEPLEEIPKIVQECTNVSVVPKSRKRVNNNVPEKIKDGKVAEKNNHKLTEYFPVRRSVRKTKKTVLEEKQRSLEQTIRRGVEEGLEVRCFNEKGRGVVASKPFTRGDFVVEYSGDLIDIIEAKERETKYALDKSTGCYMYYFKHNGHQYCVDATAETGRLGRLVNHSRNGNLMTRTILVDNKPRLVLIAKDDIKVGEEVMYDYGDRSKESLRHHPWLAS